MKPILGLLTSALFAGQAAFAQGTSDLVIEGTALEVVALQESAAETHCTGVLISSTHLLTHADCMTQDGEGGREVLSFIPGLNSGAADGPGASMPLPREFVAAQNTSETGDITILQMGLIEGRQTPKSFANLGVENAQKLERDQNVQVIHYAGRLGDFQYTSNCTITGVSTGVGALDCPLPDIALGAPVFLDGDLVGIIGTPRTEAGSEFITITDAHQVIEGETPFWRLGTAPFGSVNVMNFCAQDVHQGLLWLETDGETWSDLARRIPAQSRVFLPVNTIGDAVFSYGRSDDGQYEWRGDDVTVRMRGAALPMRELKMPSPTGDLTIIYECE
jgi:hypothetical protein